MNQKLIDEIEPFIVMEVLEKAKEMEKNGANIIHLEVGEPDFDIPKCVSDEMGNATNQGNTHYTHSLGSMELREAIAVHYNNEYKTNIVANQVVVTSGSSPAILLVLSSLIEPNDEVIISDPGYACYPNFIRYVNGKTVRVPVYAENGFQFSVKAIEEKITAKTKAIIINSPMNPTGNLLDYDVMKSLSELGPCIISDEIYHGLVYEGKAHSILEFTNNAFVINGFSKAYAMTGLRLGYAICPPHYIRAIQKLQQNLFICASSIAQQCGVTALKSCETDVENMKNIYDERRKFIINRLLKMGFKIPKQPTGAFYVFVDARHLSTNSYQLAFEILEKAHVGVTPGIDFGPNGEGFLRFSYANSIENIDEGLNRIEQFIKNRL